MTDSLSGTWARWILSIVFGVLAFFAVLFINGIRTDVDTLSGNVADLKVEQAVTNERLATIDGRLQRIDQTQVTALELLGRIATAVEANAP